MAASNGTRHGGFSVQQAGGDLRYWSVQFDETQLMWSVGGYVHGPWGGDSFTSFQLSLLRGSEDTPIGNADAWLELNEHLTQNIDVQADDTGDEDLWERYAPHVDQTTPEDSSRHDVDEREPDDNNEQPANHLPGNECAHSPARPDLVSAAMRAQGGQIRLEQDTTFRLHPNAGDYLLWIRCRDPWCNPPEFAFADFWEFREGDRLLVTNREEDYPAAVEQMEEGGPSLWRALPGDRLAWVGWRQHSTERKPTLIALFNCLREGYVYGEPASPTLDSVMSFGAPTSELTPEIRSLWAVGYDAAAALGLPQIWKPPE